MCKQDDHMIICSVTVQVTSSLTILNKNCIWDTKRKSIKNNQSKTDMGKNFACKTDELGSGNMKKVTVDGKEIVLVNVNNNYFACSDTCTHSGASLSEGKINDSTIICGWHGAQFNCKTGTLEKFPATINNLQSYNVIEESGDVFIET